MFRRAFFIVLTAALTAAHPLRCSAEAPFTGISTYAGMSPAFPAERILAAYPEPLAKPAIAVLAETFGSRTALIENFIDRFADRPHLVELHFSNETARRGRGRSYVVELLPELDVVQYRRALLHGRAAVLRAVRRRAAALRRQFEPLRQRSPNTVFLLSTGLESKLSSPAHRRLAAAIRAAWPVTLVRSPAAGASCARAGADLLEAHGVTHRMTPCRARTIFNMDGTSIDAGDGETWNDSISPRRAAAFLQQHREGYALLLWSASLQGLDGEISTDRGHHAPPSERRFVFTPKAAAVFHALLEVPLEAGFAPLHAGCDAAVGWSAARSGCDNGRSRQAVAPSQPSAALFGAQRERVFE